ISENALTAVSLAFPMQQIVTAIAVGTATGVSAVWARHMGQGQRDSASRAIRTMTFMSLSFTLLFLVLGLFVSGPLYRIQTDVPEIAEMARST
ncbi:MAG: MATE family efflux transporter, partial [Solobacterium sp.]|nr:MATE family efflux transporter [Solobacterium sp.]